jgi:hypothetical protein
MVNLESMTNLDDLLNIDDSRSWFGLTKVLVPDTELAVLDAAISPHIRHIGTYEPQAYLRAHLPNFLGLQTMSVDVHYNGLGQTCIL